MMRVTLIAFTLVFVLMAGVSLESARAGARLSVSGEGPGIVETTPRDWLRHPQRERYYTESWTTILRSTKGDTLFVTFVYSNIGVISGNTAVNIVHIPAGRPSRHFRYTYATRDYGENPATGRIVIGPNSKVLRGRDLQLRLRESDFELDAEIKGAVDGVKFHDGRLYLDERREHWMQTFFHIPRGSFGARLVVNGESAKWSGDAYSDHAVQNKLSTDFSERWWTMRLFTPEHSLSFIAFRTPEKAGGELAMRMLLTGKDELLAASDQMSLEVGGEIADPKGHRYETRYRLSYEDPKVRFKGTVERRRKLDREAFMENLGRMERLVAEMVAGNPIVYRMEAAAEIELTLAGGATTTLEGDAIIETIVMGD